MKKSRCTHSLILEQNEESCHLMELSFRSSLEEAVRKLSKDGTDLCEVCGFLEVSVLQERNGTS